MSTNNPSNEDAENFDKTSAQNHVNDSGVAANETRKGFKSEISSDGLSGTPQPEKADGKLKAFRTDKLNEMDKFIKGLSKIISPAEADPSHHSENQGSNSRELESQTAQPESIPVMQKTRPLERIFPFMRNDSHHQLETGNLNRNDPQNLKAKKDSDSPQNFEQNSTTAPTRFDEEIFQKREGESTDSNRHLPGSPGFTQSYNFEDEDPTRDENFDTLADKIKKGSVPPETIRLMITTTMSEEEVILVSQELGVDWETLPGNNWEEKIQSLIVYFQEPHPVQELEITSDFEKPKFITSEIGEDWQDSDNRLHELQELFNNPVADEKIETPSLVERVRDEFDQSSMFLKILMVSLTTLAIVLLLVIALFILFPARGIPGANILVPSQTLIHTETPYPTKIQFPGGWTFDLETGSVKDGSWNPSGPEWLQGTVVCRLISLPWSKQMEAVYSTIEPDDELLITMSNKDFLSYKIESTRTIDLADLNQLVNRDSPCLIVVLTQKQSNSRQVVIAAPGFQIAETTKTATELPSPAAIHPLQTQPLQSTQTP